MKRQPVLTTKRIVLRPLLMQDDLAVRELARSKKIADMCIWPLYGYGRQMARRWIGGTRDRWASGRGAELWRMKSAEWRMQNAEPWHWGHGYATEAAAVVLLFGFESLKLNRVYARHLVSNTASARVLRKVGMKREGLLREFARKENGFEDAVIRAILRREWQGKS